MYFSKQNKKDDFIEITENSFIVFKRCDLLYSTNKNGSSDVI